MPKKGISRKRNHAIKTRMAWHYYDHNGKRIASPKIIDRCNRLVLPPAWSDVWISPDPNASLQATGRDVKGRVQYRYHEAWTRERSEMKYASMTNFANLLQVIRKHVNKDLARHGMPKLKVTALIVTLIDRYHFRVGNDEYARENNSYGLTTLKEGHVRYDRSRSAEGKVDAIFEFVGKSGKLWKRRIWEDDLAKLIEASGNVGGSKKSEDLFRYEDAKGKDYDIKSGHINEYLDAITGEGVRVTAKDFRTWAATWKTAFRLSEQLDPDSATARKKVANEVIKTVSSDLGNTPAICRSSYIHPIILSDWSGGSFRAKWNKAKRKPKKTGLSKEESAAFHYLAS